MGTQQILMIVLSVIIVGVAVGVGITMFQNQAVNSNRQAVIADLNNFAAQAIAWYKLPVNMGGGGNGEPGFVSSGTTPTAGLLSYIGFVETGSGTGKYEYSNDNGTYSIAPTQYTLEITGVGKEQVSSGVFVGATLTIDMREAPGNQIEITINN